MLLIGLMGAGKSSVGTELARKLEIPYLDNDVLLREQEGCDAATLALTSREHLHAAESRQLRSVLNRKSNYVAGVAASVVDRPDDLALLRQHGCVVYLHVAPEVLGTRVRVDPERPWVGSDPHEVLRAMYLRRDHKFRDAADVVMDNDADPQVVAMRIMDALGMR